MNLDDVIKILLIIGLLTIVGCFVFITYYLTRALRSFTDLAEDLQRRTLSTLPSLIVGLLGRLINRRR